MDLNADWKNDDGEVADYVTADTRSFCVIIIEIFTVEVDPAGGEGLDLREGFRCPAHAAGLDASELRVQTLFTTHTLRSKICHGSFSTYTMIYNKK